MSRKAFLFFASICTFANPFHSSALEPSFVEPSPTPPVIVNANEDQRYNVHDRFIVKGGDDEGRMVSITSLFPRFTETATTNQRPRLVQQLVESKKARQRQAALKPKLTVVVDSEPELAPEEFVDDVVSEDPVETPRASLHHHHHHKHHVARHHHAHRHHKRQQSNAKQRRYGRTAKLRIR